MFDHQVCEPLTVDQNDALRNLLDILPRSGTERRGCDKHTLVRAETDEAPYEALASATRVRSYFSCLGYVGEMVGAVFH